MKKHAMKKLRSWSGFSIVEVLVAVLILLMVSSVVVGGIPVAQRAYEKVTKSANAQVLLSTTITELRNELGTASKIRKSGDGSLIYRSGANGVMRKLYKIEDSSDGKKGIMIQTLYSDPDDPVESTAPVATPTPVPPRLLVSDAAASKNLYVTYDTVDVDKNKKTVTFNGLMVYDKDKGKGQPMISQPVDKLVIGAFLLEDESNGSGGTVESGDFTG